jgi:hypothetical protein
MSVFSISLAKTNIREKEGYKKEKDMEEEKEKKKLRVVPANKTTRVSFSIMS